MTDSIKIRRPVLEDGMKVYNLIKNSPPLDPNSSYCNFLQCSHFANTSVTAEAEGEVVGFISGYLLPNKPNTLFVWQVVVSEQARGAGLASRMLQHLLQRDECRNLKYIETTIDEDNRASRTLFERLAQRLNTEFRTEEWLDRDLHFGGEHPSEPLIRIGPF